MHSIANRTQNLAIPRVKICTQNMAIFVDAVLEDVIFSDREILHILSLGLTEVRFGSPKLF
jgi:hypothetical protein